MLPLHGIALFGLIPAMLTQCRGHLRPEGQCTVTAVLWGNSNQLPVFALNLALNLERACHLVKVFPPEPWDLAAPEAHQRKLHSQAIAMAGALCEHGAHLVRAETAPWRALDGGNTTPGSRVIGTLILLNGQIQRSDQHRLERLDG